MAKRSILALGHSHLIALLDGYEQARDSLDLDVRFVQLWDARYEPLIVPGLEPPHYNEALMAELLEAHQCTPLDAIAISLLGSEHFIWSVQGHVRPFDLVLPFATDLPRVPDLESVPYGMIHQFFREALGRYFALARFLAEQVDVPVVQILPPPPVSDQGRLPTHSPEPFKGMIQAHGAPGAVIRYKLWLIWCQVAREIAEGGRTMILAPPSASMNHAGLLLPEYFHTDPIHANAHYGELVWRQIQDLLNERETVVAYASV